MINLMTAEQARSLAEQNKFKLIEREQKYVFDCIRHAAEKGLHRVEIPIIALTTSKDVVLERLRSLGYRFQVAAAYSTYGSMSNVDAAKLIVTWEPAE